MEAAKETVLRIWERVGPCLREGLDSRERLYLVLGVRADCELLRAQVEIASQRKRAEELDRPVGRLRG